MVKTLYVVRSVRRAPLCAQPALELPREIGASRGVKMYCIRMWRVVSVVLLARSYNLRASKVDYPHPMQEHLRAQASRADSPAANESK